MAVFSHHFCRPGTTRVIDHSIDRAARHRAWRIDVGSDWTQHVWLDDETLLRKMISKKLSVANLNISSVPESLQKSLHGVRLQRPQYDLPLLTVGHRVAYLREFHSIVDFNPLRKRGQTKSCLILVPALVDLKDGVVIGAIVHGL